jgi:hypothetical protein
MKRFESLRLVIMRLPTVRLVSAAGLLGVALTATGCTGGYYVNSADYRGRPVPDQQYAQSSRRVVSRSVDRSSDRPSPEESSSDEDLRGTVGRSPDLKPWPKRDTEEWKRMMAEEEARNQRIDNMLRTGICRGC